MKVFIAGATGATGKLLAELLIGRNHSVVTVVRDSSRLPNNVVSHPNVQLVQASLLHMTDGELNELTRDCNVIVSCLGHNLSFRGIWAAPYRLVTEAARRLTKAGRTGEPNQPGKFILMSSAGIRNPEAGEKVSFLQSLVISLLKCLVPPHADNEAAASFLCKFPVSESASFEWVAVRPDSLTDNTEVSPYTLHPSPVRSAIFDAGKTSRINVARFIVDLVEQKDVWQKWNGKMPVIYNKEN